MKDVIFEFSMVLKFLVFEESLLPVSLLKLSLKGEVRSIFFSKTMKLSIFKRSPVIMVFIFECQPAPIGLIFLKISHEETVFVVEFSVALFLFIFVHLPSKNGLAQIIYFGLFDGSFMLKAKLIDFLNDL